MKPQWLIAAAFFGAATALHAEPAEPPTFGEEAAKVELLVSAEGTGRLVVNGCSRCPLQLAVNEGTVYELGEKRMDRDRARLQSGRGATVVHRAGTALRVRW